MLVLCINNKGGVLMQLTLKSVSANKFTLEVDGIETVLDAVNLKRALFMSAINFAKDLDGLESSFVSYMMAMKELLNDEEIDFLIEEYPLLQPLIVILKMNDIVSVDIKSWIPQDIIKDNQAKLQFTRSLIGRN